MAITDREFWPILKQLIPELQDEVISIDIHCEAGELVTMTIKSYVIDSNDEVIIEDNELLTETKRYKLVEIED